MHRPGDPIALKTALVVISDRSGSMNKIREDAEGGINDLIVEQCSEEGTCLVTLVEFSTGVETVCEMLPANSVPPYVLRPRGNTALLDAIGDTLSRVEESIEALPADERPDTVIVAVMTDGGENASREWTKAQVFAEVTRLTEKGWQFSFIGANQDAIREGGGLGVNAASSLTYDASGAGVRGAVSSFSAAASRVRRGEDAVLSYSVAERKAARS